METVAKTLAGVHTHTHTHTCSLIKEKMNINKKIAIKPIKI